MKLSRAQAAGLALLSLLSVIGPVGSLAAKDDEPVLSSYFVTTSANTMREVADRFEVHERHGNGFEIYVPSNRVRELKALVPDAKLVEADIHAPLRSADLRGYHDFQSVETELKKIAEEHGDIAKYDVYGQSKEGRPLHVLTLTGTEKANKAEVMLTSSTHGNELITVEVLFGLLNRLVDGYGNDERLTKILNSHVIYFIPVVNPDGYTRKSRYANGVDPNREYPWPEQPGRRPNQAIQAIMDFFDSHDIKGSLDYHSAAGIYMYPWSYTSQTVPSEDHDRFKDVARRMAATNGYRHGQIPHVLYVAKGGSADYYYWKNKSLAMAVEIGDTNTPPSSEIPRFVEREAEALWLFLESIN